MATDWPSFLNHNFTVTRARSGGVKNDGQSVANHPYLVLKNNQYIGLALIDFRMIGHRLAKKFDSSKAIPSNSGILVQK